MRQKEKKNRSTGAKHNSCSTLFLGEQKQRSGTTTEIRSLPISKLHMTIGTSTVCLIHLPMGPFTLWPWLSQCSARCRLLCLHLRSKPGWNQNHYHFKCVICLPYFQITVLCSRRHVTGCGMQAALSPTPELSQSADCICPRMAECARTIPCSTQDLC